MGAGMYTENEVLEFIKEEDVKFVRLAFFSLTGKQKNISILASELPRAFKYGVGFDASSVDGFQTPDKSDMFLHPDPATITILPWRPSSGKVVRMFCDIKYPDGTPYEKDCRYLLKKAVQTAKDDFGMELMFGSEIEFYLFKLDENGDATKIPFDNAGYMDIAPEDKGENIRREICFTLEQMGIRPEASHHEEGPGQNEIDFHYGDALSSADNTATFKWVVRTKAAANGLSADFSPKPLLTEPGSGMHINLSCHSIDKNDRTDYMEQVLAGIIRHIEEMTLFLNPLVNSYDRLGECKAPKYISWSKENRSQLIRIPASREEKRIELRSPDPQANPYLAFTLLIYAALDGIKNNLVPPPAVDGNLFEADIKTVSSLQMLPDTIEEAKRKACGSEFIKNCLGEGILKVFLDSCGGLDAPTLASQ